MQEIIHYVKDIKLENWIGIAGFIIAVVTLVRSLNERRIRIDASYGFIADKIDITIYNNSTRKIIVTYFSIYRARFKWFFKKKYGHTWHDDGDNSRYIIAPYEYTTFNFSEQYSISHLFGSAKRGRVYIKVVVSDKKTKTIRLQ